ncbi:MAG: alpha/beta fold hydrolase [Cyclobacteriaceae bacterium]
MKLNFKKMGQGSPLIILHGLFGSSDNWMSVAKDLEKDYSIYLIDLRNHGDSGHSDEWNYQVMAEDLQEFMADQKLESAFILGHSMGGKTAMFFAVDFPEKVDKLIVVDIAPRPYPVHHQKILEGLNAIDLENVKSRKDAEDQLLPFIPEKGIRQFLLKNLTRKEGKFAWKINLPVISRKIENVGEAMKKDKTFEKPVLFMGGAHSKYIQDKDKEDIDRIFPNSHLVYIKDAGHWLHAEQPDAVVQTIKAFLK